MLELNWKRLSLATGLGLSLIAAGCGTESAEETEESIGRGQEIDLAYGNWDTEIASTYVLGQVLEDLGYDVSLTSLDLTIMWEAVATGSSDAMIAAWLPVTNAAQLEEYGDDLDDMGTNLEGAAAGLVVPAYMEADSIEDLTNEADMSITGIESGTGMMAAAELTLEKYENLSDWELNASSAGAMIVVLEQAIENEEEVVAVGWAPHWMFQTHDLKFLEDPMNSFGEAEEIRTFGRLGLEEEMPEAHYVIEQFYWTPDEMGEVMLDISEGASPEDAAEMWIEENPDRVAEWTEDLVE